MLRLSKVRSGLANKALMGNGGIACFLDNPTYKGNWSTDSDRFGVREGLDLSFERPIGERLLREPSFTDAALRVLPLDLRFAWKYGAQHRTCRTLSKGSYTSSFVGRDSVLGLTYCMTRREGTVHCGDRAMMCSANGPDEGINPGAQQREWLELTKGHTVSPIASGDDVGKCVLTQPSSRSAQEGAVARKVDSL